ncbi:fructose 1 6-bisphosphatase-like protein [Thermoanaerobacter sp. X514]|nr:fructose 1,6-bisphosphatase [Thermoanaerobacter sp. X514]ABY91539.1 fructose 1 6-bisphosphatase-like protein [Thermoanaerobacter sp. X514]
MSKITLTVIKADVGGFVGHTDVHPELLELANKHLKEKGKMLIDFYVTRVGDDIELGFPAVGEALEPFANPYLVEKLQGRWEEE